MTKIAVTGSKGFIGSNLVPMLKEKGYQVIEIALENGVDLTRWEDIKDFESCEIIIHLAARTFVPDSFDNPREFYHTNQTVTLNALELARKWKARFIYMSSYFYGPPQYLPVDENHPIAPHNPYAQSKYLSEELCRGYSRDFRVPAIAFRLFNIYGPQQTGNFLIPQIIQQLKTGKIILKDPRPKRDFIHVKDVVSAIERGIETELSGFNVFNLGTGKSWSVEEVSQIINKYASTKPEITFTHEHRKGEVLDSVACIMNINEQLGWLPRISLDEGLKEMLT